MPHLVEDIRNASIQECSAVLNKCLEYLVHAGSKTASKAAGVAPNLDWGINTKRTAVNLSVPAPPKIGKPGTNHSLAEVINQCANIRRMIDLLDWCSSNNSGFSDHQVTVCHPTTSSGKHENDLVLSKEGLVDSKFEVTDVVGDKDGNNKEATDLKSLGFLKGVSKEANAGDLPTPLHRGFLVVSDELAKVMTGKKRWWRSDNSPIVRYERKNEKSSTNIFEVIFIHGEFSP